MLKVGPSATFDNDEGGYVDVRGASNMHIFAFENDATINQRLLIDNGNLSTQLMVDINEKFAQMKVIVPTSAPGFGSNDTKVLNRKCNEKNRQLLGFELLRWKSRRGGESRSPSKKMEDRE